MLQKKLLKPLEQLVEKRSKKLLEDSKVTSAAFEVIKKSSLEKIICNVLADTKSSFYEVSRAIV